MMNDCINLEIRGVKVKNSFNATNFWTCDFIFYKYEKSCIIRCPKNKFSNTDQKHKFQLTVGRTAVKAGIGMTCKIVW